ncbi:MAG: TMEM175 family protein [Thermoanaerobaculia bacterium]
MLRDKLIGHKAPKPHEFRWRSREISRLEGLSDAIFGFAVTLLIVALEVPKTSAELLETMRGFVSFGITFALLYMLWYRQFLFFRRYGLEDRPTVALNGALLFVVLFFVFPLKFFLGALVDRLMGGGKTIRLPNGEVERIIQPGHLPLMLMIYGAGFAAVSVIFALLYTHAYRQREELELNELEVFDTRRTLEGILHTVVIGLFVVAQGAVGYLVRGEAHADRTELFMAAFLYAYVAFMIYRTRRKGRERKEMVARIQAAGGDVVEGPGFQS